MGIIKKTTGASLSLFSLLFGRHNLKNTKNNIREVKRLAGEYKKIVTEDRVDAAENLDGQAYNQAEYLKRFRNLRIYTSIVLITCAYYVYCVITAPSLYDLACRTVTAGILLYLYMALARYMTKLRLAYEALPNKLTEEEGSITWSRFATLVANTPSLLLPLKLNKNNN